MTEFVAASYTDVKDIDEIARITWPNTFEDGMSQEQINYMLDLIYNEAELIRQMDSGHNFLLIKFNNDPIGFTSYELNYLDKPQLMIHKVYLLPLSQGLGIGKKTFDYLIQIAKETKQKALTLKVFYKNVKAIGFYEKKGFKSIGTETTDIGNSYIILDNVMSKKI